MASATKSAGIIAGIAFVACVIIAAVVSFAAFSEDAKNAEIIRRHNAARLAAMTPEQRAADARAQAQREQERKEAEAQREQARKEADARAAFPESARGACYVMLTRLLDDPDSAQYGRIADWPTHIANDGTATILPTIRAKNGFGAYRLTRIRCTVERVGLDSVKVTSITQI